MTVLTWTAVLSLVAWLWLLLGQGFFWRTDVRLPPGGGPGEGQGADGWPEVAVVVPARDEAEVLPLSLPSLLAQDYPGRARIVLVDDGSTDGTDEVARKLAEEAPRGLPLTVRSPGEPEPGWTGKLWAVRHGMRVAREEGRAADGAEPEFLLLTDADIAHAPDSLRRLVSAARVSRLDLVSQMARLRVVSGWERLIVPAFVYFFAQLYPFRWINRPSGRTAAAAGGCVLLRTETAVRAGLPDSIRDAVIDDVTLGRTVKRAGGRIWLGLAEGVASVRPYSGLRPLWGMVARSAYAQLRNDPLLLVGTVLGLALVYLVPPVAACAGSPVGGAAWALMTLTYLPMLRHYRQPLWLAPLLPVTAALYLAMTVNSAVRHYRGRGAAWKGRTYS